MAKRERYEVVNGNGWYGNVVLYSDGWRFFPALPARKPSRKGWPTAKQAIPGWVPKSAELIEPAAQGA